MRLAFFLLALLAIGFSSLSLIELRNAATESKDFSVCPEGLFDQINGLLEGSSILRIILKVFITAMFATLTIDWSVDFKKQWPSVVLLALTFLLLFLNWRMTRYTSDKFLRFWDLCHTETIYAERANWAERLKNLSLDSLKENGEWVFLLVGLNATLKGLKSKEGGQ